MAEKERIYTIPVNDAFSQKAPCPMCRLAETANQNMLEYYLGPSLMEPDVRQETNEHGFCSDHMRQMYNSQKNRLGMGLMLHTHMQHKIPQLDKRMISAIPGEKKALFGSKSKENYKDKLRALAADIRMESSDCVICERIQFTLDRYMDVIFWQFFHDDGFRRLFEDCEGFCNLHTASLLEGAAKYLNQQEAAVFCSVLVEKQQAMHAELIGDVEWFTQKFDYRNKEKPWGKSKDALSRSIMALKGELDLK